MKYNKKFIRGITSFLFVITSFTVFLSVFAVSVSALESIDTSHIKIAQYLTWDFQDSAYVEAYPNNGSLEFTNHIYTNTTPLSNYDAITRNYRISSTEGMLFPRGRNVRLLFNNIFVSDLFYRSDGLHQYITKVSLDYPIQIVVVYNNGTLGYIEGQIEMAYEAKRFNIYTEFVPQADVEEIHFSLNNDVANDNFYKTALNKGYTFDVHSYVGEIDDSSFTIQYEQQSEESALLEDVLDNQEELPGEIGEEIQDIIDNEKQEAEGEGNKFVDQILDALPDPSTEVLGALKSLTDSTAYNGTDAVLPVPAIVLPGIDGLFPETEIWGGANLDFGEYVGMLPPALVTLVQSLFTIAIVIYCVYELKGIISYCLTLKESKGG